MATSHNKINAVLYTGFNSLTSRARHLRHNRRSLNRHYTVFGEVFLEMAVLDKIAGAREEFDNPLEPIPMTVR
ncbi:MAG: peptidylprolyl isomerase [Nitrospirota bacterium]